jgi:hypothetical protein
MPDRVSPAAERARSASGDVIKTLIHGADEATLLALVENPNLDEPSVNHLLDRLDLPVSVLAAVADAGKWTSSEQVRLRLAAHPRTPSRIALALLRQLFLFDLVRVSLLPSAPAGTRRAAEGLILARIPHLPVGEKLTLARRGPSRIAAAVLAEGHPQAIKLALANPLLAESQILKVLAKPDVPERTVAAIAQNPRWSCRYNVRLALVKSPHTPPPLVLAFLRDLTLRDLQDVAQLESLPPYLYGYIASELVRRESAGDSEVPGNLSE